MNKNTKSIRNSLYSKFESQQINQKEAFNDYLMTLRMTIELSKGPVFSTTTFVAKFIRDLQNGQLKIIGSKKLDKEIIKKHERAYKSLKIYETDMTIDMMVKTFREIELLARLLMSLKLTDIKEIMKLIEHGDSFESYGEFYKNSSIDELLDVLYGMERLDELNITKKERHIIQEIYLSQKEIIEDMFHIITELYQLFINIRHNYFHTALWFPNIAMEELSRKDKKNVLHEKGRGLLFSMPNKKRLPNNVLQFSQYHSGIRFTSELSYLIQGIIVFQKVIIDYYLINLQRDQIFSEMIIGEIPENLVKSYKEIVQKHYGTSQLELKIAQEQTDWNLGNKQLNLLNKIEIFNKKYSPKYIRKGSRNENDLVQVKQSLHLVEKDKQTKDSPKRTNHKIKPKKISSLFSKILKLRFFKHFMK